MLYSILYSLKYTSFVFKIYFVSNYVSGGWDICAFLQVPCRPKIPNPPGAGLKEVVIYPDMGAGDQTVRAIHSITTEPFLHSPRSKHVENEPSLKLPFSVGSTVREKQRTLSLERLRNIRKHNL